MAFATGTLIGAELSILTLSTEGGCATVRAWENPLPVAPLDAEFLGGVHCGRHIRRIFVRFGPPRFLLVAGIKRAFGV